MMGAKHLENVSERPLLLLLRLLYLQLSPQQPQNTTNAVAVMFIRRDLVSLCHDTTKVGPFRLKLLLFLSVASRYSMEKTLGVLHPLEHVLSVNVTMAIIVTMMVLSDFAQFRDPK